jgi:hypothetical protein
MRSLSLSTIYLMYDFYCLKFPKTGSSFIPAGLLSKKVGLLEEIGFFAFLRVVLEHPRYPFRKPSKRCVLHSFLLNLT